MKMLRQFKFISEASIFCSSHNMTSLLSPNNCFKTLVPPRKVSHYHHISVFTCSSRFLLRPETQKVCRRGEGNAGWLALKLDAFKACLDCEGHPI